MNESSIALGRMRPDEAGEVAELIHLSTNYWYEAHRGAAIFRGDPVNCLIFPEVYEALDPGCCIVAVEPRAGRIVGSCFFHPRPTHVSVGIVNTHPSYAGRGIARRMIAEVLEVAGGRSVRLVSSLLNLDSYSLYTRSGFVPRAIYQDMLLPGGVPADGLAPTGPDDACVRPATLADVAAIAAVEKELVGIERADDWRYFLADTTGRWHVSLLTGDNGAIAGALGSVSSAASNLIGPGFARTEGQAAALLRAELIRRPAGDSPVFLIPADAPALVAQCHAWGARNVELHTAQVRGAYTPPTGIVFPTFMPESG